MQLTRRVALNGIWMDELDSRIVIRAIEPADGRESINGVPTARGYGQRVTGNRRETVDIVIRFAILEHGKTEDGMAARSAVLEAVNAWAAAGGWLTVNYKPNRRLRVILAQAPGEGSLWDYTKEFQLTFRAFEAPYWEEESAKSGTFGGSTASGSGSVVIDGSAKCPVNVTLTNTSGATINNATVTVGGQTMAFTGLGLPANASLVISHTDDGLLVIKSNGQSAMAKRTAESADDFLMAPGTRSCSYSAQRACRMTVSWRSRFL